MRKYSAEIAESIKNFLTADDWNYQFNEEAGVFTMGVKVGGKLKTLEVRLIVYENKYTAHAIFPLRVDVEDETVVHEILDLVSRINYNSTYEGHFDFDLRDGELRTTIVGSKANGIIDNEQIRYNIYTAINYTRNYGDGFLQILFNNMTGASAFNQVMEA